MTVTLLLYEQMTNYVNIQSTNVLFSSTSILSNLYNYYTLIHSSKVLNKNISRCFLQQKYKNTAIQKIRKSLKIGKFRKSWKNLNKWWKIKKIGLLGKIVRLGKVEKLGKARRLGRIG